ncbi:DUF6551 family protein [Azospirillum sp. SYSU D00513]|uniref:DUF6551 family protein n=1 Tax=Azospirillum sp. SYSU D00513 TaxID=2812561 RepID=UPI001A979051|nr:DUF6551 family protein [Azospirillum sp. SYSU D00513]
MTDASTLTKVTSLSLRDLDPAKDLGPMPEFCMLPKDWLFVDAIYQRAMSTDASKTLVRKIVEEFSWSRFQPVTVTPIDWEAGKFAVVDGQHRAAAALLHPGVTEVPAWVIDAPEARDQARAFVGVNLDRIRMTTMQLFRAQLTASDPDAMQVKAVCERAGIRIAFHLSNSAKQLPPRQTMAVSTIRKLIAKHGERPVFFALSILAEAYAETPNQLRGQVIQAVTMLVLDHGERIERERLVRVLGETDCESLLEAARQVKKLMGGSTEAGMVAALVSAYDKGRMDQKRLVPQVRAA